MPAFTPTTLLGARFENCLPPTEQVSANVVAYRWFTPSLVLRQWLCVLSFECVMSDVDAHQHCWRHHLFITLSHPCVAKTAKHLTSLQTWFDNQWHCAASTARSGGGVRGADRVELECPLLQLKPVSFDSSCFMVASPVSSFSSSCAAWKSMK